MLVGSNISPNKIDWRKSNRITEASNSRLKASQIYAGDVVVVRVGAPGIAAVVPKELDGVNCASMMIIRKHPSFSSEWLCALFNSQIGRDRIDGVQYGTAQKQFNIADAVDFVFPCPPLPEQEAIAEALSDADGVIEGLERLMRKKRRIKQGAMQDLLTATGRLPGFSGEWEELRLGAEASLITKGTTPTSIGHGFQKTGVSFVKVESITDGRRIDRSKLTAISDKTHDALKRSQLVEGDILISIAGAIGRVGVVPASVLPANTNQALAIVRMREDSAIRRGFAVFALEAEAVQNHWQEISVQGAQPNISLADVGSLMLSCPSIAEQDAIASVLHDMDAEIAALEARLEKARLVKEGMMQNLLTGRIRLV